MCRLYHLGYTWCQAYHKTSGVEPTKTIIVAYCQQQGCLTRKNQGNKNMVSVAEGTPMYLMPLEGFCQKCLGDVNRQYRDENNKLIIFDLNPFMEKFVNEFSQLCKSIFGSPDCVCELSGLVKSSDISAVEFIHKNLQKYFYARKHKHKDIGTEDQRNIISTLGAKIFMAHVRHSEASFPECKVQRINKLCPTATDAESLAKIKESKKCGICSKKYKKPRKLPCGHIFCESHIEKLLSEDVCADAACPLGDCTLPCTAQLDVNAIGYEDPTPYVRKLDDLGKKHICAFLDFEWEQFGVGLGPLGLFPGLGLF